MTATILAVTLSTGAHAGAAAKPPPSPANSTATGMAPLTMGANSGLVVKAPSQFIRLAAGTFEDVDVNSVTSVVGGEPTANAYKLQLNTNYFPTLKCQTAPNPKCEGWQQFVYANNGISGELYVAYWLRNFRKTTDPAVACPDEPGADPPFDWVERTFGTDIYCYLQTQPEPVNANPPIKDLAKFALTADLTGALTKLTFTPDNKTSTYTHEAAKILDPAANWTMAEFNVFGYDPGTEATLVTMVGTANKARARVRTRIEYGSPGEPGCEAVGFTNDSNNLYQVPLDKREVPTDPASPGEKGPALVFAQNATPTMLGGPDCTKAVTVGDTHQITFAGLLYDFQASGDFVEAEVGTDFEVQARKVSGAPVWPNASLNRSAAVRMGSTRVAICEGSRLMVDGVATTMPPGGLLTLPSGVTIQRRGSVFYVRDRSGNNMHVELKGSYIDLQVGLGKWPTPVRGLMGNPNNDPRVLMSKTGVPFTVPTFFNSSFFNYLYNTFAPSWRVSPTSSLLSPCNPVAQPGNPTAPFFVNRLPFDLRSRAANDCLRAGVGQAWMDACTLDVAVLETPIAAAIYIGRPPPVVDGTRCSAAGGGC